MKSLRLLFALAFAGFLSASMVHAGDKAECAGKDAKKCCAAEKGKDSKECGKDKACCANEAPKAEKAPEAKPEAPKA